MRKRAKPFYKPLIYRGKSDRNDARSSVPSFRPYSGLEIDLDLALNAAAAGTWGSSGRQPPTVRPSILRDTSPHLSRRPCVMARPSHLTNNRQRAARHEPAEFIMVLRYPLAILSIAVGALFVPPASAANIAAGRQGYQNTCAMCHGADGKGTLPGMPNFHQTGGVLSLSDSVLFDRIEHGYKSSASPIAMPPKGGNASLTKQDIKNVLAYLHQKFGATSGARSSNDASQQNNGNGSASLSMGAGMKGNGKGHGLMTAR